MVRELSTSRAFGPSGVKGDELAAVEFVPFDDLLALDHFADVAVDRPQGDPGRRPDVLRLFGDGYARCRLSCSGGTPGKIVRSVGPTWHASMDVTRTGPTLLPRTIGASVTSILGSGPDDRLKSC